MGNDGGSIPKRRELVKEAARNPTTTQLKETLAEKQSYYWTTDPLTNKPLCLPIVSDCTGRLFNKEAVIKFLLPGDADDDAKRAEQERVLDGTVRSLKDVVEVKFERDAEGAGLAPMCPISNKPLGPGTKAVYLVPCGHAFSEVAIREVKDEKCLLCNEPYALNDVIPLIPTSEEDVARLLLRVQTLKENGLSHSLKKASGGKKRKKHGAKAGDAESKADAKAANNSKSNGKDASKVSTSGIKLSSTASLTAKVLEEQEARNKRRKMENNENLNSLFSSKDKSTSNGKANDFMTRGFTIPAQQK